MSEIIVGIDSSPQSSLAAAWAADAAGRRGSDLRLVNVVAPWLLEEHPHAQVREARRWVLGDWNRALEDAAARARDHVPGLQVFTEQVGGTPAGVLVERGRDAVMTVVGTHGADRLTGALLGSVSHQVATHATGPVVVVGQHDPVPYGEIVVGVDGSPGSEAALAFAFEEASLRGARLRAILAWTHPVSTGPGDMQPLVYDREIVKAEEERLLTEAVAGWHAKFPDLEVVCEAVHGRPARVLAGASARADLLVVGARGRGGFAGLLLGSVGQAMLHRAHCPVAVIHTPHH